MHDIRSEQHLRASPQLTGSFWRYTIFLLKPGTKVQMWTRPLKRSLGQITIVAAWKNVSFVEGTQFDCSRLFCITRDTNWLLMSQIMYIKLLYQAIYQESELLIPFYTLWKKALCRLLNISAVMDSLKSSAGVGLHQLYTNFCIYIYIYILPY